MAGMATDVRRARLQLLTAGAIWGTYAVLIRAINAVDSRPLPAIFVTTVRFDAAYHGLFKCNLRRLTDYPALTAHAGRMLDLPGVRATVSLDHIRRGYHSIRSLNPAGIVPVGPALPWDL